MPGQKYKNPKTGTVINWEGPANPSQEDLDAAERDLNFRNKAKVAIASQDDRGFLNTEHNIPGLGPSSLNDVASGILSPFYYKNIANSGKQLAKGLSGGRSGEGGYSSTTKQLNDVLSGAMGVAAPIAIPAGLMGAPAATLAGLASGIGAQIGAKKLAQKITESNDLESPDPDLLELGTNLLGLGVGGKVANKFTPKTPAEVMPGKSGSPWNFSFQDPNQGRALPPGQETLPAVQNPIFRPQQEVPPNVTPPPSAPVGSPQLNTSTIPPGVQGITENAPPLNYRNMTQNQQPLQEINPFATGSYNPVVRQVSPGGDISAPGEQLPNVPNPIIQQAQTPQLPEGTSPEQGLQLPVEKPNLTNSGKPGILKTPEDLQGTIETFRKSLETRLRNIENKVGVKTPEETLPEPKNKTLQSTEVIPELPEDLFAKDRGPQIDDLDTSRLIKNNKVTEIPDVEELKQLNSGELPQVEEPTSPQQRDYNTALSKLDIKNSDSMNMAAAKGQGLGLDKTKVLNDMIDNFTKQGVDKGLATKLAAFRVGKTFGDIKPVEGTMELPEVVSPETVDKPGKGLGEVIKKSRYKSPTEVPKELWGTKKDPWRTQRGSISTDDIGEDLKRFFVETTKAPLKAAKSFFGTTTHILEDSDNPSANYVGTTLKTGDDLHARFIGNVEGNASDIIKNLSDKDKDSATAILDGKSPNNASPESIVAAKRLRDEVFDPILKAIQKAYPQGIHGEGKPVKGIADYFPHIEERASEFPALHAAFGDRMANFFGDLGKDARTLRESFGSSPEDFGTGSGFNTAKKPDSRFFNQRDPNVANYMTDLNKVLPMYIESAADVLFRRTAIEKSLGKINDLTGVEKDLALQAIRKFASDSQYPTSEMGMKAITGPLQRNFARSLLWFNPGLYSLHIGRLGNVLQDLPASYFAKGAAELMKDPVGSYQETMRNGLLPQVRPWAFMKPMEKMDHFGNAFGLADFIPDAIAYKGFKQKFLDEGYRQKEAEIKAITAAKDASLRTSPSRGVGFNNSYWGLADPVKQFKGIQSKLVEQYLRNGARIVSYSSDLTGGERAALATRMAIGTMFGLIAMKQGYKMWHMNPSSLFDFEGGALGNIKNITSDFYNAINEEKEGHSEQRDKHLAQAVAKMMKFIPGVASVDKSIERIQKGKNVTGEPEEKDHPEFHKPGKPVQIPLVRFMNDSKNP